MASEPVTYNLYASVTSSGDWDDTVFLQKQADNHCKINVLKGTVPPENRDQHTFNVESYLQGLTTRQLGRTVIHAPLCHSTQLVMLDSLPSLPLGTVVTADAQSQSKGRGANVWECPKGQLAFTFKFGLPNANNLVFVQYLISLYVVKAIHKTIYPSTIFYSPVSLAAGNKTRDGVRMKWPNDIYANGLKIGGILCNSIYNMDAKRFEVVCGIGLNVLNSKPTTCLADLFPSVQFQREKLLFDFFNELEPAVDEFITHGFGPFTDPYLAYWLHGGERLVLDEGKTDVTVQGLTPSGYLLAVDAAGQRYELHPDFNSLDFFRGLIKKKIL